MHFLSPLLLLLTLLFPFTHPLELKVQIVGWHKEAALSHLLNELPGKRFMLSLYYKHRNRADVPLLHMGERRMGHYDIATFKLSKTWLNEMLQSWVTNNEFMLTISTPTQPMWMKTPLFSLSHPNHNFVRVTRNEMDRPDAVAVLPLNKLELPVRHLLFRMQPNSAAEDGTFLFLKSVECQRVDGWRIGDHNKGQKILLAKEKRVCEEDTYLVHTSRYIKTTGPRSGREVLEPARQLFCNEAVHVLGQINIYYISAGTNGQLLCTFMKETLNQKATDLILSNEKENIFAIWKRVEKMQESEDAVGNAQINVLESSSTIMDEQSSSKKRAVIATESRHHPSVFQQQQSDPKKRRNSHQIEHIYASSIPLLESSSGSFIHTQQEQQYRHPHHQLEHHKNQLPPEEVEHHQNQLPPEEQPEQQHSPMQEFSMEEFLGHNFEVPAENMDDLFAQLEQSERHQAREGENDQKQPTTIASTSIHQPQPPVDKMDDLFAQWEQQSKRHQALEGENEQQPTTIASTSIHQPQHHPQITVVTDKAKGINVLQQQQQQPGAQAGQERRDQQ